MSGATFPAIRFSLPANSSLPSGRFFAGAGQLHLAKGLRSTVKFIFAAQSRDHASSTNKGTSKLSPKVEYSESVNEELLIFLFQLDLASRLQRALNQNQYQAAQLFREKIAEVDNEAEKQQRERRTGAKLAKSQVQDKELTLLRLRTELNKAVEGEDYQGAAQLRDQISKLEAEALAASIKALAYQNVKYAFRLGQKVKHKLFGYRGVICGMDPVCCESEEWCRTAKVDQLSTGRNQPFYQVLVDAKSHPQLVVAYVAEENLEAPAAPAEPDLEALDHPYIYFLFFGMDKVGDYIPTKQLRERYDAPRHEPSDET